MDEELVEQNEPVELEEPEQNSPVDLVQWCYPTGDIRGLWRSVRHSDALGPTGPCSKAWAGSESASGAVLAALCGVLVVLWGRYSARLRWVAPAIEPPSEHRWRSGAVQHIRASVRTCVQMVLSGRGSRPDQRFQSFEGFSAPVEKRANVCITDQDGPEDPSGLTAEAPIAR